MTRMGNLRIKGGAIRRVGLLASRGASAVEYAVIVALIAIVVVVSVRYLGSETEGAFESTSEAFGTSPSYGAPSTTPGSTPTTGATAPSEDEDEDEDKDKDKDKGPKK